MKRSSLALLWALLGAILLSSPIYAAPITDWDDDGVTDAKEGEQATNPYYPMESLKFAPRALVLGAIAENGVSVPVTSGIVSNNDVFTVEFWVKPYTDDSGDAGKVFANGTDGCLYNYNNGELEIRLVKNAGDDSCVNLAVWQNGAEMYASSKLIGTAPDSDKWTHVALEGDGAGNYSLYVDEMTAPEGTWFCGEAASAGGSLVIGKGIALGFLDEFRYFTSQRTTEQLVKNTTMMCTKSEDLDLGLYYRFDDGGITVEDFAHLPDFETLAASYDDDAQSAVMSAFRYRLVMPDFADVNGDGHADWVTTQACAMADALASDDGDGDGIANDAAFETFNNFYDYAIVRNNGSNVLETKNVEGEDKFFANGAFSAAWSADALFVKAGSTEQLSTIPQGGDLAVTKKILAKGLATAETNYWNGLDDDCDGIVDDCAVALDIAMNPSEYIVVEEDSDKDGIADAWEMKWFGNLTTANANTDYDSDGVTDYQEFKMDYNPKAEVSAVRSFWTDVDGEYAHVTQNADDTFFAFGTTDDITDKIDDLAWALTALDGDVDFDGDYLGNALENDFFGTNPLAFDTDSDGLDDWAECMMGTDPADASDPWQNRGLDLVLKKHDVSVLSYDEENNAVTTVTATVAPRVSPYAVVEDFNGMIKDLSAWSAEMWIKLDAESGLTGTLLQKTADKATLKGDFWMGLKDGKLSLTINDNLSKKKQVTFTMDEAIDADVWTHVAVTVQKTATNKYTVKMVTFADGEEKAQEFAGNTGIINPSSQDGDLVIGDLPIASSRLSMVVDELRVWNKVLTRGEIRQNRDIFLSELTANLAAYFQFNYLNAAGDGFAAVTYKTRSDITGELMDALEEYSSAQERYDAAWNAYPKKEDGSLDTEKATDDQKNALASAESYLNYAQNRYTNAYVAYYMEMTTEGMIALLKDEAILSITNSDDYQNGDSDSDGIADWWEYTYFGDLASADASSDNDGDLLSDYYEYLLREEGADPTDPYSLTGDGATLDGDVDSDGDGLANAEEMSYSTDPLNVDTDDDGISDKIEVVFCSNPTHPMSIVVTKADGKPLTDVAWEDIKDTDLTLYRATEAPNRSLDLGALDADLVLPDANRFAVGVQQKEYKYVIAGDFTLELWLKGETGAESGVIFETKAADTGWGWRLLLENGVPKGEIFDPYGKVIALVGGIGATPALEAGAWTYLALNWSTDAKTLNLYRDKVAMIGSLPVTYSVDFGSESEYATIFKTAGVSIDEFRFWNETRTAEQIEYWAERIIPSPLKIIISYDYQTLDDGSVAESRYMTREYKLKANYRFDDGGKSVEDFAHFREDGYALTVADGSIFDFEDGAKVMTGVDDVDGDGVPEWWTNTWGLNAFPNGTENLPFVGWAEVPGHQLPYNLFLNGDSDWQEMLVWNDEHKAIEALYGYQFGVAYTSLGGSMNYTSHWNNGFLRGTTATLWGHDSEVGGRPEGAYISDNQVLGVDMAYVTMHKYINLNNTPSEAYLDVETALGASITGVIINQHTLESWASDVNVAEYLHQGRNQVVIVWSRSVFDTAKYKIPNGEGTVDYSRDLYEGSVDASLMVDGNLVIAKGHYFPYDPRAVWYYRATTKDYSHKSMVAGRGNRMTDSNGYILNSNIVDTNLDPYAYQFGALADKDNDGLDFYSEYLIGSNPSSKDSDNNGIFDGKEDYDNDGIINDIEINSAFIDPLSMDTDNDGIADASERASASDPADWNSPVSYRFLQTDGTDGNYLQMPLQSRFALSNFTIEAMVYAKDPSQGGIILQRVVGTVDEANPVLNYELGLNADGKPYMAFTDKEGNKANRTLTAPNAIEPETWTHLAMVFDENTNLMTLYVDGVQAATGLAAGQPVTTGPALVYTRAGVDFEGGIDELRFWKDVRTAAEIQANMDLTLAGNEDNLVAYYRFDDANMEKRVEIAKAVTGRDDLDDAAIRADISIYSKYLNCADSVLTNACDWRSNWSNAAVLAGTATVVEDPNHSNSFKVGVYAYSYGTEEGDEDPGVAYVAPMGSELASDILQAVILTYPASASTENLSYKYFWVKSDAAGYGVDDLNYASDALYNASTGSVLPNSDILGHSSELSLDDADVKIGDYVQLVVAAVNADGLTSVLSTSNVLELKEATSEKCIPKALILVSPTADQTGLAAGAALNVQVKNANDFAGVVHVAWYRNLVLAKTSTQNIAAKGSATLSMNDTSKVVNGDVWSFKAWFVREESGARSKTIAPAAEADDPTDEWIFMQIGKGYDEDIAGTGSKVFGKPDKPVSVKLTPVDPDPQSVLVVKAEGSRCSYPYNYYYQWYYKANTSATYVLASGQTLPVWQPAVSDIANDMGLTADGFMTYVLDPGDQLYCSVNAMNIYGEVSKNTVSNVVVINNDSAAGSYYENDDDWKHARPIYSKTTWFDNADPNIQAHLFEDARDVDWVWFVVPASTDKRKMLVSFETNSGVMYNHNSFVDDMAYTAPNTALTLYRLSDDGKKLNQVLAVRDFVSDDDSLEGTGFARFEKKALDPGIYYLQVWEEYQTVYSEPPAYYMHLYMEREPWSGEGITWNYDDQREGAFALELTPGNPGASDELVAKLNITASDSDDNKITDYRYLWYRNGVIVPLNGVPSLQSYQTDLFILNQAIRDYNTIPSDMTKEGDVWQCVVYPYSSTYGYGAPVVSNIVVIGSSTWSMELTTRKSFKSGAEVLAGDETVVLGWEEMATFGYDASYDSAAPSLSIPAGDGTYVRQAMDHGATYSLGLSNDYPYLVKDVRPYGKTSSWFIVAELGNPTSDTINEFALSWDAISLPVSTASGISITQMRKRTDGYFEAVIGSTVEMQPGVAGEIVLSGDQLNNLQQDENGQKFAIFRVTIGAPDSMQTIELKAGWNLVALSLTPLNGDVDDVFSLNGSKLYSGSIWQYEGGRYVAAKNLVATKGYWLYAKTAAKVNVYGTAEADVISLSEGWNIVGPVYEIADFEAMYKNAYPQAFDKIAKTSDGGLEIYKFDPATGGYLLAVENGKYVLKLGNGYWIKTTEAVELPIVIPMK
ncbi:MAG: LamG domain-containing protein [Lentisphaeria bacterium]|nr:LamG domain-containing protein [Lentisphaeria bacterium]